MAGPGLLGDHQGLLHFHSGAADTLKFPETSQSGSLISNECLLLHFSEGCDCPSTEVSCCFTECSLFPQNLSKYSEELLSSKERANVSTWWILRWCRKEDPDRERGTLDLKPSPNQSHLPECWSINTKIAIFVGPPEGDGTGPECHVLHSAHVQNNHKPGLRDLCQECVCMLMSTCAFTSKNLHQLRLMGWVGNCWGDDVQLLLIQRAGRHLRQWGLWHRRLVSRVDVKEDPQNQAWPHLAPEICWNRCIQGAMSTDWKSCFSAVKQGPHSLTPHCHLFVGQSHSFHQRQYSPRCSHFFFPSITSNKEVVRNKTHDKTDICQDQGHRCCLRLTWMTCYLMPFLETLSYVSFCSRVCGWVG